MATKRPTPQHSIPLYPEVKELLEKASVATGKPKARILYDACVIGLREMLRELHTQ